MSTVRNGEAGAITLYFGIPHGSSTHKYLQRIQVVSVTLYSTNLT